MGLFKPARQAETKETKTVVDLDELVSRRVSFVWHGKTHYINPITTIQYLEFIESSARVQAILADKDLPRAQREGMLYDEYGKIFALVCDTMKPSDARRMTMHQMGVLLGVIRSLLGGEEFAPEVKKKMTEQAQPPSQQAS